MRRSISCILASCTLLATGGLGQEEQITLGANGLPTVVIVPPEETQEVQETEAVEEEDAQVTSTVTLLVEPQATQATQQPDDEEEEEDDIVIDPFTPVSRIEWVRPGIVTKFHLQNLYPSGTTLDAEWKYTERVIIKPDNLTLFRNKRPAERPPGKVDLWTEIATFPFVEGNTTRKIEIGSDWLEGANYYFKLEANYNDPRGAIYEPQGKLITAVTGTSAPIRVYHRSVGDVFRSAAESGMKATSWTLMAAAAFVVFS